MTTRANRSTVAASLADQRHVPLPRPSAPTDAKSGAPRASGPARSPGPINIVLGRDRTVLACAEPVHADHLVPPGRPLRDSPAGGTCSPTPSQFTLQNYKELFTGGTSSSLGGGVPSGFAPGGALDSLRTSLEITIPATILVTVISSLTAYSLVFGRWRGRNVVFLTIVGLMVVPLQVAILPVVDALPRHGQRHGLEPVRDHTGRGHFPRRFRAALRHLLDAQLLHRDTRRP